MRDGLVQPPIDRVSLFEIDHGKIGLVTQLGLPPDKRWELRQEWRSAARAKVEDERAISSHQIAQLQCVALQISQACAPGRSLTRKRGRILTDDILQRALTVEKPLKMRCVRRSPTCASYSCERMSLLTSKEVDYVDLEHIFGNRGEQRQLIAQREGSAHTVPASARDGIDAVRGSSAAAAGPRCLREVVDYRYCAGCGENLTQFWWVLPTSV